MKGVIEKKTIKRYCKVLMTIISCSSNGVSALLEKKTPKQTLIFLGVLDALWLIHIPYKHNVPVHFQFTTVLSLLMFPVYVHKSSERLQFKVKS